MIPIIFISHRTIDKPVADMLRDFLIGAGIPGEYIFCSSLPGNDVKESISKEVREKIQNSSVNIAVISQDYYRSAYCVNEAGVIWLHENTPAVVIGLPEITPTNMVGFLNSDYKLRRLDNIGDISQIYDTVREAVHVQQSSISVVTAANTKLIERYKEFLRTRSLAEAETTPKDISIQDITTDDERVVLYYILTKKVRRLNKADLYVWLNENELYNVNIDNAFDLLSTIGNGRFEGNALELDIELFRKLTADAQKTIDLLLPIVMQYKQLSSKNFIELWKLGGFKDKDKLFIAYIIQNKIIKFGANWKAQGQQEDICQWEENNGFDKALSNSYVSCLNNFAENNFIYESDWTEYGNVKEYMLCASLKDVLLNGKFPFSNELNDIIKAHMVAF